MESIVEDLIGNIISDSVDSKQNTNKIDQPNNEHSDVVEDNDEIKVIG